MFSYIDLVDPINDFAQEAMGTPSEHLDLWHETAHAVLFSASWEPFSFWLNAANLEYEEFNEHTHEFLKELSIKSAPWIEENVGESSIVKVRFGNDFSALIQHRLYLYFSIGMQAMADRGYDLEQARAHSCKVCLSEFLETFSTMRSLNPFRRSFTKKSLKTYLDYTLDYCKERAVEMHGWTIKVFYENE